MRNYAKQIVAGLLMTGMVLVFSGCARRAAEYEAFDPEKEYTVTVGVYGDLEAAYTEVFASADFRSLYPNITVEMQSSDFNGHHNRLTTIIAANEVTNDIEALEVAFIARFVEGDALRDLTAEPFNGRPVADDIVSFAVSNASTGDGKLVAMPVDVAPMVLFYREGIVREAGVDPAVISTLGSWEDFIEVGRQLTRDLDDDGKIDRYAIPHANDVSLVPLNGGKAGWFSNSGTVFEPKNRFIRSLQLVQDVRASGIDADLGAWSGPWVESFRDGRVASIAIGAWFGGALRNWVAPDISDWRVAPLPGGELASFGGTYLSIPKTVPENRVAAAWKVMEYLTSNESSQLTVFRAIDAFPAVEKLYDHPIMDEEIAYFGGQQARQLFAEVARAIPNNIVNEYDALAGSIWSNAVTEVLLSDLPIEDAYMQARDQVLAATQ